MEDGIEVEFSLTTFIPDSVTLESVWVNLSDDERSAIMAELAAAMGKLYSLNRDNEQVRLLLKGSKFVLEGVNHSSESTSASTSCRLALGSPNIGYAKDSADFLRLLVKSLNKNRKVPSASIQPSFPSYPPMDLDGWTCRMKSLRRSPMITSSATATSNLVIYSFDAQRRLTVVAPTKLPQLLIGKCQVFSLEGMSTLRRTLSSERQINPSPSTRFSGNKRCLTCQPRPIVHGSCTRSILSTAHTRNSYWMHRT